MYLTEKFIHRRDLDFFFWPYVGFFLQYRVFWNDDNSVPDVKILSIELCAGRKGFNDDALPQAGIFVDDGAFNFASFSDTDGRVRLRFIALYGVVVGPHDDRFRNFHTIRDDAAQTDHRIPDDRLPNAATVCHQHIFHGCPVNGRTGEKARTGENWTAGVVHLKW